MLSVEFESVGNPFRMSKQFEVMGRVWQCDGQGLAAHFREKGVYFFELDLEVEGKGEGLAVDEKFHNKLKVKN
jgi:hypothetical protein